MADMRSIIKSPLWAIAAILITTISVVYAVDAGGQSAKNATEIKEIQSAVHSLDIDRNVSKTQYSDLKETMVEGFREQKESTSELKELLKSHILRTTGLSTASR